MTMTYRGHLASVHYDPRDKILVGRLLGVNDIIGFHGDNGPELEAAFHEAVDEYIEMRGEPSPRICSGKLMLRVKPEVHEAALLAARASGNSLNAWAEAVLRQAAARVVEEAVPV